MKVILLGEIRGKGGEGDIVDVAQGYAENFLFPNRLALPATDGNIKQLEERRHNIAAREEKRIADAQATKEILDDKTVKVDAKVGDEGQLYGSVTGPMIADAIAEQLNVTVDRKRIDRAGSIKTAGIHEVQISLYREISAKLFVQVGDEAAIAAAAEASGRVMPTIAVPDEVAEETAEEAVEAEVAEEAVEAEQAAEEAAVVEEAVEAEAEVAEDAE